MEKDKVEAAQTSANPGAGLIPFGIVLSLLGIGMIGLLIPYFIAPGLSNFQSLLAESGSEYAADFSMPYIILGGGILSIIAGIVALVGGFRKNRVIGIVAIVLSLAAAGLKIGPAAYLQSVLSTTFLELQASPFEKEFSAKEKSLLDVGSAIFNECCFKVYDTHCGSKHHSGTPCVFDSTDPADFQLGTSVITSNPAYKLVDHNEFRDNQLPVRRCTTKDASCPSVMFPPVLSTVQNFISSITDLLCMCYTDDAKYDEIVQSIVRLNSCSELSKMVIENAGPVSIPKAGTLTFGQLPGLVGGASSNQKLSPLKDIPLTRFAVVGKMLPPPSIFGEPQEPVGWSCGLGYAKGMTFAIYLGIDRAADIGINGAYGVAGAEAFFAVVLGLYWIMGGGSESEDEWDQGLAYGHHYVEPDA